MTDAASETVRETPEQRMFRILRERHQQAMTAQERGMMSLELAEERAANLVKEIRKRFGIGQARAAVKDRTGTWRDPREAIWDDNDA